MKLDSWSHAAHASCMDCSYTVMLHDLQL